MADTKAKSPLLVTLLAELMPKGTLGQDVIDIRGSLGSREFYFGPSFHLYR